MATLLSYVRATAWPRTSGFGLVGGAEGIRTPDLLVANETRYQLRHSPITSGDAKRNVSTALTGRSNQAVARPSTRARALFAEPFHIFANTGIAALPTMPLGWTSHDQVTFVPGPPGVKVHRPLA